MLFEKSFLSLQPLDAVPVTNAVIMLVSIFLLKMHKDQKCSSFITRWNFKTILDHTKHWDVHLSLFLNYISCAQFVEQHKYTT